MYVWQVHTGRPLFCNRSVQTLLAGHSGVSGPMPPRYLRDGRHAHRFYRHGRVFVSTREGGHAYLHPTPLSLAERLGPPAAADALLLDFLGAALTLDDDARPAAADLLHHPWLSASFGPPPRFHPKQSANEEAEAPPPPPPPLPSVPPAQQLVPSALEATPVENEYTPPPSSSSYLVAAQAESRGAEARHASASSTHTSERPLSAL